jgi:hypothetical protein
MMPSVDKAAITPSLVSRLVAGQFPQWAGLPVRPVELAGWDNATFRLGEDMSVRLPSGGQYAPQVDKEHRWLPALARQLPLPPREHRRWGSRGSSLSTGGSTATTRPPAGSRNQAGSPPTWLIFSPPCTRSIPLAARRRVSTTSFAAAR